MGHWLNRTGAIFFIQWLVWLSVGAWVAGRGAAFASLEDFPRLAMAFAWAGDPFFAPADAFWLPLPAWLYGGWYRLAGRPEPMLWFYPLSAALIALSLALMQSAVRPALRRLPGWGALAHWLLLPLALAIPLAWRLPCSALSELTALPLLAGVCQVLTRNAARPRLDRLYAGWLLLLGLQMTRYEFWPLSLGAGIMLWLEARRTMTGGQRCGHAAAGAMLLGGFPLAWLAINGAIHGDPLHFLLHAQTDAIPSLALGTAPWDRRLAFILDQARSQGWPLMLGGILGLWLGRRRRIVGWLAGFALMNGALYVAFALPFSRHTISPERMTLPLLWTLMPLAALGLGRLLAGRWPVRVATLGALAVAAGMQIMPGLAIDFGGPLLLGEAPRLERIARLCHEEDYRVVVQTPATFGFEINRLWVYCSPGRVFYAGWLRPGEPGQFVYFPDPASQTATPPDGMVLGRPYSLLEWMPSTD